MMNADQLRETVDNEELANLLFFLFVSCDFRSPEDVLDFLEQETDVQ